MKRDRLLFFTHNFPYGSGETFVYEELVTLAKSYSEIYIMPLHVKGTARPVPAGCKILHLAAEKNTHRPFFTRVSAVFFVFRQWIRSGLNPVFFKKFRYFVSLAQQLQQRANQVQEFITSVPEADFYSFWGDDWATVLAILKKRGVIDGFTMRLHGFDLYNERWSGGYIPFRHFQLKQQPHVLFVSKAGRQYFLKKHPRYRYTSVNYLKTADHGMARLPHNETIIVSCSNIIDIKRVDLLARAIGLLPQPVKWVHFGDGAGMETLKQICTTLPPHITTILAGHISHDHLMDYYLNTGATVFVHVSESEGGVPLVIQEAVSMGIPVVATNTGGVPEIVNENCGKLLPLKTNENEISDAILQVIAQFGSLEKRQSVRQYWKTSEFGKVNL